MENHYFGLVCDTCNVRYPIGEEALFRTAQATADHILDCPVCKTVSRATGFKHWDTDSAYPDADLRSARLCVTTVPPS